MRFLLFLLAAHLPGIAHGVTIYRFGGEDLPRPPEVGQSGVVFRQAALDPSRRGGVASPD